MVELQKQNIPEKSPNFFDNILGALKNLKNKLTIQKTTEKLKDTTSKEKQEFVSNNVDLNELQKEILTANQKRERKSELLWLKKQVVSKNSTPWHKNTPFQYTSTNLETIDRLEKNKDIRPAAPWIAQSADDLRNDIKSEPILNYFLG